MIKQEYFKIVERKSNNALLSFCLKDNKKIVLMPAGLHAQSVWENYLEPNGIDIDFFIDNNKKGSKLHEKDVLGLEAIAGIENQIKIIFATNLQIYNEIKPKVNLNIIEHFYAGQQYCIYTTDEIENTSDIMIENYNRYKNIYNVLEDDLSKLTLDNHIKYRLDYTRNNLLLQIQQPQENQYFEDDIYKISKNDCIVDCGAYDGDTLRNIYYKYGKDKQPFEKYYAFEPSVENFNKLKEYTKNMKYIEIINKGVSRKDTILQVANGGGTCFSINNSVCVGGGGLNIDVVALDNYLKDKKVTFIKMDIEGSEIDALIGAKNIIKTQAPTLAICVYHKFNDIFDIPELIQSFGVNYKYYLRHYSNYISETVLYAVKK